MKILNEIAVDLKGVINKIVPGCNILLFGSNARGDSNKHSDIDLLLITTNTFTPRERIKVASQINKILVNQFHLPFDILIRSKTEVEVLKKVPGNIIRSALKEGFLI